MRPYGPVSKDFWMYTIHLHGKGSVWNIDLKLLLIVGEDKILPHILKLNICICNSCIHISLIYMSTLLRICLIASMLLHIMSVISMVAMVLHIII